MDKQVDQKISVVVLNWNGKEMIGACLDSLQEQTLKPHIIVVENASIDGSLDFLKDNYPDIEILPQKKNLGFAGGVNVGIKRSLDLGDDFVALFNNDAVADEKWLEVLVDALLMNEGAGIATGKLLTADGQRIDSTGDIFTIWGLSYPRGRGEETSDHYDRLTDIFGASGGASLYRNKLFEDIGLFDEDFFAYYEDIDISFRAQLAGWKVAFAPNAIAYHHIGVTSGQIKGFYTYQAMKNQPMLLFKNVPRKYLFRVGPRFALAYAMFFLSAFSRGQGWAAAKGCLKGTVLLFKKAGDRRRIQKSKAVSDEYIWKIIVHGLPPNAHKLRRLINFWRKK